ncbi:MAG: copper oxidase, partial [Gammaproteobacteria bacterium]
ADLALGAQTTVQRWFADYVLNMVGADRTLRSVFTHDHFGPSTHQHPGLYAALVIEPEGSTWRDPETGAIMGTRMDGGPTSWRADILTPDPQDSYREFMLEMADFQLAYERGFGGDGGNPHPDPQGAINPPGREAIGLPFLLKRPEKCPNGNPPPCPEGISADDPGTFTVNYRNEPLALRILDPQGNFDGQGNPMCIMNLDGTTNCRRAPGKAGDPAYAFQTRTDRAIPVLNTALGNTPYPPLTGDINPGDPFTPLMRLYQGDKVQIRALVGATEEGHIASIHGVKWLQEASWSNSGYRNAQMLGISEHFEFEMPILPVKNQQGPATDLLYMTDASTDGLWNGVWGLMRAYRHPQKDLLELPNNRASRRQINDFVLGEFKGVCPRNAPLRQYDVTAVLAASALPEGTLIYNPRGGAFFGHPGPLHDPTAILYVHTADLNPDGTLKAGVPIEPLVLRARAGECIEVTLRNQLPDIPPDADGFNTLPMIVEGFNANQVPPSSEVGLHPQLVTYDVTRHDGLNVGKNVGRQTVPPGKSYTYRWYAGNIHYNSDNLIFETTPVEFGAVNLMPADRIKHTNKGLIGALIIEPIDAEWMEDPDTHTAATVTYDNGTRSFREFVVLFQDDINLQDASGNPIGNLADA